MINIDYHKIAKADDYYSKKGYKRVEAPWWVSQEIANLTKPNSNEDYLIECNKKVLVASGEQSFLYMVNKGRLVEGQYFTTTPCFRNESIGILHKKCFLKTELIKTDKVNEKELKKMINICYKFFLNYFNKNEVYIMETSKLSYDIELKIKKDNKEVNIELGSYGIRSCEFLEWIYGTGCAEPRLSRAIKIKENIGNGLNFKKF